MAGLTGKVQSEPIELAGNLISPNMFAQLQDADVQSRHSVRTARLESDSQSADVKLAGTPLWLRAEPDADRILSQSIADDLEEWIKS